VVPADRDAVLTRYPIGRAAGAAAELSVCLPEGRGEGAGHLEILLQVATDLLAGALVRVGSQWAPPRPEHDRPTASELAYAPAAGQ
jgi:hypothetical protein